MSGWVMLATGAMYVLLGSCCLQGVMERVRRDDEMRWMEYYDRVAILEREMELGEEEGQRESGSSATLSDASPLLPSPSDDGGAKTTTTTGGWSIVGRAWFRKCILGMRRRARGCDRRRRQWNRNGLCQFQLKCRTIDWKW